MSKNYRKRTKKLQKIELFKKMTIPKNAIVISLKFEKQLDKTIEKKNNWKCKKFPKIIQNITGNVQKIRKKWKNFRKIWNLWKNNWNKFKIWKTIAKNNWKYRKKNNWKF